MLDYAHIFGATNTAEYLKSQGVQFNYLRQKDIKAIKQFPENVFELNKHDVYVFFQDFV